MKKVIVKNEKIGFQNETYSFHVRDENELEFMASKLMKKNGKFYKHAFINYDARRIVIAYFSGGLRTVKKFSYEIV